MAAPRAGGIQSARYKKRSATHRLLRIETAALCCTRSLGDGSSTISISSVRGTPHAHGAMGLLQVKPEGGEGERDGVQEGGNSCPQGRTLSAWHLEQKKSSQGRLRQGTANITQGARTAGIWTWPFSGAVMSLGALSSSSHRHSIAKLARPLTLLPYHTLLLQVADPQSHRAGLFTRLKRSILPAPLAGSIAEREADSQLVHAAEGKRSVAALCHVEECTRPASWIACTPVVRGKSEFSHRLTRAQAR